MTTQSLDTRFSGRWIGETQGCEMPAHVWEIAQHGTFLTISARWEDETFVSRMIARVLADEPAFAIGDHKATLVDPQHFIIPEWDTNDKRGGGGPAYDVVFSRPGIAELTACAGGEEARSMPPRVFASSPPTVKPKSPNLNHALDTGIQ